METIEYVLVLKQLLNLLTEKHKPKKIKTMLNKIQTI